MIRLILFLVVTVITQPLFAQTALELPMEIPKGNYMQNFVWVSNAICSQVVSGDASPFGTEESSQALHVINDMASGESQFRFRARLWQGVEPSPQNGIVKINLRLVKGSVIIRMGVNLLPPSNQIDAYQIENLHFTIRLTEGEDPSVIYNRQLHSAYIENGSSIEANQNVTLAVKWNFSAEDEQFFSVFLNENPLAFKSNHLSRWKPTDKMIELGGVNVLSIVTGEGTNSEYFIGPITFENR